MKRTGNLYHKIIEWDNLLLAFYKAAKGKRTKAEVILYEKNLNENLKNLQKNLIKQDIPLGNYRFFKIYDPKERLICAASFSDRVLHHAIINITEPVFEKFQIYDSYACRKNKGAQAALLRALYFSRRFKYFLKLDMKKYFDSISHIKLNLFLKKRIKDRDLFNLLKKIVASYSITQDRGLPIGNLISQYFANFYLSFFDRYAKEKLRVKGYIRYMDDVLLFSDNIEDIKLIQKKAKNFLSCELDLTLKEEITDMVKNGIPFLGFLVKPQGIYLSQKKKKRLKKKIKDYVHKFKIAYWTEEEFALHITPVFAHIAISRCRAYCNKYLLT
jgi:reverse transcriptase family protein